jgi:hypothetical protein
VLVISGASGSGKSSLLRAGLIPRLRRKHDWVVIRPFEIAREPVRNLLDRLSEALAELGIPADGLDLTKSPDDPTALAQGLDEALRRLEQDARTWVLLPLDQAEVLITGDRPAGDPGRLALDLLTQLLGPRNRHLVVAATIRTEFAPRLEAVFAGTEVRLRQAPLSAIGSLAEVIEKPAERFGIELEPGLSERIMEDVSSADALPLLAYTLKELHDRGRGDQRLTLDEYRTLGGVQGAIATKLGEMLSDPEPTEEENRGLRRVFTRHLIRVDEGAVEGERLLRRVVPRTALPKSADRILRRLVDAGLLTTKDGTIELAHERLINDWPKLPLKTWVTQDATDRRLIEQLRDAANDDMLPDGLLAQAEDLLRRDQQLATEEPELAQLVQRSRDQKRAFERQRRRRVASLLLLAVVSSLLAALALAAYWQANKNAIAAELATRRADAAANQAQVERDNARGQLLAVQARRAADANAPDDTERAGALALESIEVSRKSNRPAEADAIEAVSKALMRLPLGVISHGTEVGTLAVGRLASGGEGMMGTDEPEILSHGRAVKSLAVLADGRLASGGTDDEGTIKLWPKEGRGQPEIRLQGSPVESLVTLADGRLASGGRDGKIKLWLNDDAGEPVVLSHGSQLTSLAALADGGLASGGTDGKIKLWPKGGSGEPVVLPHGSLVESLAVLGNGQLATGGTDGKIKLWLVDEQKLIAALCLRAGRNLTKDEWARYVGSSTPWQPSCRDRPSNWRTPDP